MFYDVDTQESLLSRYRANKCNALVLYQPPVDLFMQMKEQDNNNFDEKSSDAVGCVNDDSDAMAE
jgi:hypothetical protein